MNWLAALPAVLCTACATAPIRQAESAPAESSEPVVGGREWTDQQIRDDLERSVRASFGEAALARATAAEASILSKLYRGMPLPPVQQPDGIWKEAAHPTSLLIRENGRWHRASSGGFAPVDPAVQKEVETLLGSAAFWAEPARIAQGGCTDGGSTLFLVRMPGKQPQVRQGTCGGPPLHSRLISAVY